MLITTYNFAVGEDESVEAKEMAASSLISSIYNVENVTSKELKIIRLFIFVERGRFLKPYSSNCKYFYYGKHIIEYAECFRPFSLAPLLCKLYMHTFHLKNSEIKNFNKHRDFVKSNNIPIIIKLIVPKH